MRRESRKTGYSTWIETHSVPRGAAKREARAPAAVSAPGLANGTRAGMGMSGRGASQADCAPRPFVRLAFRRVIRGPGVHGLHAMPTAPHMRVPCAAPGYLDTSIYPSVNNDRKLASVFHIAVSTLSAISSAPPGMLESVSSGLTMLPMTMPSTP